MSAPTALESGALARGIAWLSPHSRAAGSQVFGTERRVAGGVAVLSREHDLLCRQACDPLEIAAVLESAGVTDRQARAEFAQAGVFDLSETLWQQVPWRAAADGTRADPWRLPLWRSQLRGALYAVPAVIAAALPAQLGGGIDYTVAALATGFAIAATQALSVLGHLLNGRVQTRALAQLGTVALVAAVTAGVVAAGVCLLLGQPVTRALGPDAQLVFVVASTLLMVRGDDRLLLALVAPGALLAAIELAGRLPAGIELPGTRAQGLLVAAVGTVVLAAAGSWLRLRRTPGSRDGDPLRRAIGRVELSHAGVAGLYGLGLSALITYAVVGVVSGRVPGAGVWTVAATLPLTATIGASEYFLHRARGRCAAAAGRTLATGAFAASALRQLRLLVVWHALTVAVVAGAVLVVLHRVGAEPATSGYTIGYAVLGITLLLGTTLQSLGYGGLSAGLVCAGGAALLGVGFLPGLPGTGVVLGQVAVIAVLLLVGYRLTAVRFVTLAVHR